MKEKIKYIIKSLLIGIFGILIFNLLGQFINIHIPFYILFILLIGFLRLPGLILSLLYLIIWGSYENNFSQYRF